MALGGRRNRRKPEPICHFCKKDLNYDRLPDVRVFASPADKFPNGVAWVICSRDCPQLPDSEQQRVFIRGMEPKIMVPNH